MSTEGSGASRAGDGFHNEDVFLVEEGLGLYLVCDGASNAPGGEVASRIATDALEQFVEWSSDDRDLRRGRAAREVVVKAMRFALGAVIEAGESNSEIHGLTTTITMLLAHGDHGGIGHRGDSRAYLIRHERAHQLTVDHELTQATNGTGSATDFDVFAIDLEPTDTIVLCTDGAEDVMHDREILRVAGNLTPRMLASRIVTPTGARSGRHGGRGACPKRMGTGLARAFRCATTHRVRARAGACLRSA